MFKRSETLIFKPSGGNVLSFNYLTKNTFECSHELVEFLNFLEDWSSLEDLCRRLPGYSKTELKRHINDLVECGAVIVRGSELECSENEYSNEWDWGIPAAMLHFGVQDNECISVEQSENIQLKKCSVKPQPDLYLTNAEFQSVSQLPSSEGRSNLLTIMAKRRTNRDVQAKSVSLQSLSDCLFSGMGIVGETQNISGKLPLSMTPSGGARNPFEAYVIAQQVDDIEPGLYHYSSIEHSLGKIAHVTAEDISPSKLIGGQSWMNQMPAIVVLVAYLERSMWKYSDANAYRVMLIEAGHIAQNIMLAATEKKLTACPSAALSHEAIKAAFDIQGITKAPIYALGIGHPISN